MGAEQGAWIQRLEEEHENLRASLDWSLGNRDAAEGLRFCVALQRYWVTRGHLSEGLEWCVRALGQGGGAQERTSERAKALNGAGTIAYMMGDYASARTYHGESLTIMREIGDRNGIANALTSLGNVAAGQGDDDSAHAYYEESLVLRREIEDPRGLATSLINMGNLACLQGDYGAAQTYLEESLTLFRKIGALRGIADSLEAFADLAVKTGKSERAAALWGAAAALREVVGLARSPTERTHNDQLVTQTRADVGEKSFALAWAKGGALTREQALAYALEERFMTTD
jgi:tetratricopeptide (TPR) repeat protein